MSDTDTAPIKGRSQTAIRLAEQAIRNARLKKTTGISTEQRVMNLAKVLMVTSPRSDHGQLLMRALRPALGEYRPVEELAVRFLIRKGEAPTESAVAGFVQYRAEKDARDAELNRLAQETAAADGYRAAQFIAGRIAESGEAPTWHELRRVMGWTRKEPVFSKIMGNLSRDGWIVAGREPRSLRPGIRYLSEPHADPVFRPPSELNSAL